MKFLSLARHWFWLAPVALGIAFIASGIYMMSEGRNARDEVEQAVIAENIVTPEDASIPNVQVKDAETAKVQADVIEKHYLKLTGGKTYAELDREDPNRETAFRAAMLRTSLNLAVMGFNVADLVVGLGLFMVVMGVMNILFLAPAVYWAAEVANERARTTAGGTATQTVPPQTV
ncbi:MAG: hypothetical protein ABIP58_06515 [Dehalococcoidia bacterium]